MTARNPRLAYQPALTALLQSLSPPEACERECVWFSLFEAVPAMSLSLEVLKCVREYVRVSVHTCAHVFMFVDMSECTEVMYTNCIEKGVASTYRGIDRCLRARVRVRPLPLDRYRRPNASQTRAADARECCGVLLLVAGRLLRRGHLERASTQARRVADVVDNLTIGHQSVVRGEASWECL